MAIPTRDDCRKENCTSADQQVNRVLRRWLAEPLGRFDEQWSNLHRVRISIEFLIGRVLDRSPDAALHEYWSDGVDLIHHEASLERFDFGGACILSDRHASAMWLVPFEMRIDYLDPAGHPTALRLRVGRADSRHLFDRSLQAGREHRLFALSHAIYGGRPTDPSSWAMTVDLDPYPHA